MQPPQGLGLPYGFRPTDRATLALTGLELLERGHVPAAQEGLRAPPRGPPGPPAGRAPLDRAHAPAAEEGLRALRDGRERIPDLRGVGRDEGHDEGPLRDRMEDEHVPVRLAHDAPRRA